MVQERFRSAQYTNYNDITFRYRRNQYADRARRYSEFYKIQADYLLYGIIDNLSKDPVQLSKASFRKAVLLALAPLWEKISTGEVIIDESIGGPSYWKGEKLIVPVNHNCDGSSSFLAWDVPAIIRHWPDIIIWQKGYNM